MFKCLFPCPAPRPVLRDLRSTKRKRPSITAFDAATAPQAAAFW